MNDVAPQPLINLIDPGWAEALAPVEDKIHELGVMLRKEIKAGHNYLPAGTDVLRAFTYPFNDVKVLIVGQDPYPTPGHAMGLSFSVTPGTPIPRSLVNIFTELESDLGLPRPTSGDLTPWAREGVCLLNRVLTVRPGAPGSHQRLWCALVICAGNKSIDRAFGDLLPPAFLVRAWGTRANREHSVEQTDSLARPRRQVTGCRSREA